MERRTLAITIIVALLTTGVVVAADLKPIKTQRAKDVTVSLLNESGRWKVGRNDFVLEFTSPDKKPFEANKATVSASMAMPGMAPMITGAKLEPDGPGRYRGTISFPDAGERQVTVSWESTTGRSSTRFNVAVR